MITQEVREAYAFRAQLVLDNLRNFNSVDCCHKVGNMRNIAQGLKHLALESTFLETEQIKPILERLEKEHLEFIKQKFGSHRSFYLNR